MISELCAGHAYIGGGDVQGAKAGGVGLLGIERVARREGFYKIEKSCHGDPWDVKRSSPLAQVGLNVAAGNYLVAIDDRPTNP